MRPVREEYKINYPKLSVIVPIFNSERYVERVCKSLMNIDYPDYELIFVDGGSTDRTLDKLKNYAVKLVHAPGSNVAEARNLGIASSMGNLVAFTDHDCTVDREWAKHLAYNILSDPLVGGAGGSIYIVDDGTVKSRAIHSVLDSWLGSAGSPQLFKYKNVRAVPFVSTCTMMARKEVIEKAGFLDPELFYCEEVDLCHRMTKLGYKILYVPSSIVYHDIRLNSFKKMWTYFFSWGLGRTRGARKKKYLFSKTSVALLAGSSSMFLVAVLSLIHPLLLSIFVALMSVYISGLLLASLHIKRKSKGSARLRYIFFAYLVEHIAYTLGLFFGLFAKSAHVRAIQNRIYKQRTYKPV